MFTSFSTALSALGAHSTAVDVVGNNLANLNTPGFKGSAVSFHDLVTRVADASIASSAPTESSGSLSAMSHAGVGVSVASVSRLSQT